MPTLMLPQPILLHSIAPLKHADLLQQFAIVAVVMVGIGLLLHYLRPYLLPAAKGAQTSAPTSGQMSPDYWRTEIRESVKDGVREAMQDVVVPALNNNTQSNKELAGAIERLGEKLSDFGTDVKILKDRMPRAAAAGAGGPQKLG